MRREKLRPLLLCVVVLLFGTAGAVFGDWNEGDPNKMHHPQLPDPNGWDVNFNADAMFDDWMCSESGYVTDIHFWLSCKGDVWDPQQTGETCPISRLLVYIYADMPADDPCNQYEFSHPTGPELWSIDMDPFDPNLIRHAGTGQQGWIDWQQDPYPLVINDDHVHYYQINVTDIPQPFFQQKDTIYWLGIHLHTYNDEVWSFGWKSSQDHWNDDAVYFYGGWYEMTDPCTSESMDLAFVINSEEPNFAKPLAPHTKWSQSPIEIDPNSSVPIYCGWDEQAWRAYPSPAIWPIVADDFHCLGTMPVTSIHWWGSYIGWDGNEPPQSPSSGHEEWRIRFWSNVTAGMPVSFSWPEKMLWEIVIPEARVQIDRAGRDDSPRPQDPNETCFQYYVELDPCEVFWQDDFNDQTMDDIYWISMEALDHNSINPYHWGWKTRPWHWMDDAITMNINDVAVPGVGATVDPCTNNITPIEYQGESFDVSFELDTDPNYIKWEQLYTGIRDWTHYEDEPSTTTTPQVKKWEQLPDPNWSGLHCHDSNSDGYYSWITLADDWHCEGGDVTDLHWWGSYEDRGSGIDHFHLSIHEPNVMNPCLPGVEVWGADVPFTSLTEVNTGMVQATGNTVYLYEYDLDTPFAQVEDQNYWFDITAYSVDACDPVLWYWQEMARHFTPILCPAVSGGGPDANWVPLDWPFYGYSDMAFVITSTQEVNEPNDNLVADDWRCLKRTPVTAIAWWGSYIGYSYEAGSTGPFMALPISPNRFRLSMWTDIPASDPCDYSHPDEVIWEYETSKYDEVLVGYDKHPNGAPNEPVFRYSVRLPEDEWFRQPDYNEVFWLSVQAVYDPNTQNYPWGWTNHAHVFNDNAVSGDYNDVTETWVWKELHDQTGASEDMSFILFTDPNECSTCANYNCDSIVNFLDYADFADDWMWIGPAGGFNNSDLDCDGDADSADLAVFVQQWLVLCP